MTEKLEKLDQILKTTEDIHNTLDAAVEYYLDNYEVQEIIFDKLKEITKLADEVRRLELSDENPSYRINTDDLPY
ncbi:MAG: hypothetical protein AAF944_04600 [Bacteroidota bacterium]